MRGGGLGRSWGFLLLFVVVVIDYWGWDLELFRRRFV